MIKSDFDISRIREAMSQFSKRMNDVMKPFEEAKEEDKKTIRKMNRQNHREFVNRKCR